MFTGPNGNTILFPLGGQFQIQRDAKEGENNYVRQGFYWSNGLGKADEKDIYQQEEAIAFWLSAHNNYHDTFRAYRPNGLNIRAVSGGSRN